MASQRKRRQLTITCRIAAEPISPGEWEAAERLLAELIARAYAADHPELFGPCLSEVLENEKSGPSPAARADAVAPAARGGGPEAMELEQDGGRSAMHRGRAD